MTQTMPRLAILPISLSLLEHILQLPEGYKIIHISCNDRYRTLDVTLASEALPETQEYRELPQASLVATVHRLPDHPEYRRITTEIKLI